MWQTLVHERFEAMVMVPLHQVHHFVNDNVFDAFHRLLGKLQIEPDAAGLDVAAAPFGFHLFNAPAGHLNTQDRLPFVQ